MPPGAEAQTNGWGKYMNNKMIKGSVAGATGIVLLMGGFGTYALWSDSVQANGGSINSGVLDIVSSPGGQWTDESTSTPVVIEDISSFRMVPGDTVKLTQLLDVQATGNHLEAELVVTGVDASAFSELVIDGEYGGQTAPNWQPNSSGEYVLSYANGDLAALNSDDQATVTFELPDTVGNQVDQNKTIDLSGVTVTLRQVRP